MAPPSNHCLLLLSFFTYRLKTRSTNQSAGHVSNHLRAFASDWRRSRLRFLFGLSYSAPNFLLLCHVRVVCAYNSTKAAAETGCELVLIRRYGAQCTLQSFDDHIETRPCHRLCMINRKFHYDFSYRSIIIITLLFRVLLDSPIVISLQEITPYMSIKKATHVPFPVSPPPPPQTVILRRDHIRLSY